MSQKGFTLIELMIVVAIIGILSMFALPAYQDYTKRTYVAEAMALASAAKMGVTEYYSSEGIWPGNNASVGLPAADLITGQSILGISVHTGKAAKPPSGAAASTVSVIHIFFNKKVVTTSPSNLVSGGANANNAVNPSPYSLTIAPMISATNSDSAGSVQWACTQKGNLIYDKWLPANCRIQLTNQ